MRKEAAVQVIFYSFHTISLAHDCTTNCSHSHHPTTHLNVQIRVDNIPNKQNVAQNLGKQKMYVKTNIIIGKLNEFAVALQS